MSKRIIVLSDGESWEGYNPDNITVMEISDEGFDQLCEGTEPSDLATGNIISEHSLSTLLEKSRGIESKICGDDE